MRRLLATVSVVLVLSVLTVSCDSTQPIGAGPTTYEVRLSAVNVLGLVGGTGIRSFRVFEGYEDNDNNNQPDGPTFDWCLNLVGSDSSINPESIPWSFTAQISVIRAGEVDEEIVSSPAASLMADPAVNLTSYDTASRAVIFGATISPITINDNGTMRTFRFRLPVKLSSAHERVARSTTNPLTQFNPSMYGLGNGLCSTNYPGPAVTDGQSPYTVELNAGDTVIVRALRGGMPPAGIVINGSEPQLSGALTNNGAPVSVIGDVTSDAVPGSGITFSFTAR